MQISNDLVFSLVINYQNYTEITNIKYNKGSHMRRLLQIRCVLASSCDIFA